MVSTWHHEPKSILIGYPFKALSSLPRVILLNHNLESVFPFKTLSSWPRVVFLIYDLESFLTFKALSSWPRVILLIYDLESFLAFRALGSWPRVVYPISDPKAFILSVTRSHSSHPWLWVILFTFFPSLYYSSHTFLFLLSFPPHRDVSSLSLQPRLPILLSSCAKTKSPVLL